MRLHYMDHMIDIEDVTISGEDYRIFKYDHPDYETEYFAYYRWTLSDDTLFRSFVRSSYDYERLLEQLERVA